MLFNAFSIVLLIFVPIIVAQCSANNQNQRRASERRSRKSQKSSKSGRSKSKSKSRRSRSSKSGKSGTSASKSKSTTRNSKKSLKKNPNPKVMSKSQKKLEAAILADKSAARDALKSKKCRSNSSSQCKSKSSSCSKKNPISYTKIRAVPHEISFKSTGGLQQLKIKNESPKDVVFMIKCSDNMIYSINPVYGDVPKNSEAVVNVLRENGTAKHDKIILLTAAKSQNKTANEVFGELCRSNLPNYCVNVIPLVTVADKK